jgi:hypothetical protein
VQRDPDQAAGNFILAVAMGAFAPMTVAQYVFGINEHLAVAIGIAGALASALAMDEMRSRRDVRDADPHHCPACRYPRAGLDADAVCPECGVKPRAVTIETVD